MGLALQLAAVLWVLIPPPLRPQAGKAMVLATLFLAQVARLVAPTLLWPQAHVHLSLLERLLICLAPQIVHHRVDCPLFG